MKRRYVLTIGAALTLYALALSSAVYAETSPPSFAWHVLLRKSYSVGAFALIGFLYTDLLRASGRPASIGRTALALSLYSACIEVGQALVGSQEGLAWNLFDTACGTLGGAIGYLARSLRASR